MRVLGRASGVQPIDQPIPVEGRFDRHRLELRLQELQKGDDLRLVAVQLPVHQPLSLEVDDANHYVVAVQIHSCD
jgi:hypothetical protein